MSDKKRNSLSHRYLKSLPAGGGPSVSGYIISNTCALVQRKLRELNFVSENNILTFYLTLTTYIIGPIYIKQ